MKKTRSQIASFETINLAELYKLKRATIRAGCHFSGDMGSGCAGDPPGFPTYFLRSIYNSQGNDPQTGSRMVITHDGNHFEIENAKWPASCKSWDDWMKFREKIFLRIWNKLPIDHPRTVAWIAATFSHHRHCYQVPELRAAGKNWHDSMLIWPGGCCGDTPFGRIEDEAFLLKWAKEHEAFDKWRKEEQEKFVADIREKNARVKRLCAEVATPENHSGTVIVRRYYPEFNPTPELIAAAFESPGNWWEVMSQKPTPEECPGQYSMQHPCNGSWCQMCGWHEPAAK
jgi:hypothetical protein